MPAFRECVAYYIGGGWGKDAADSEHSVRARVIRGADIPATRLNETESLPLRFHKPSNARSRLLQEGDLVFEVSGGSRDQPVGRTVYVTDSLAEQPTIPASFCKLIRLREAVCNPKFIYYKLLSDYQARSLTQWQTQSTGIINFAFEAFLDEYHIDLPPLPTQRKIAAVLSAYDDLIANNARRVWVLEEMARALYREWFVEYRFPGFEQAEFVEDEQGRRPGEWEWVKVGDRVELLYGKALKADERKPGPYPVYGSGGVVGWHSLPLSEGPGVIVGRKGNVGAVYWSDEPFFPIDTVYYVRSKLPLHYLYFNLQGQNFINNDAAVPGLNRNQAYSLPLLVPDDMTLSQFTTFVGDLFEKLKNLHQRNANLRRTRDLLLPRLVSGELDVSELEIAGVAGAQGVAEEAVA